MNFIDQIERERDLVSDHPVLDQFQDVYEYFEDLSKVNDPYRLNQSLEDIKLIKN